ncbi:DUF2513 domain-containing protein [Paraburkholderia fungorum]|uniref:DUF2513 domain-containing protein n=1 Tax=Paraburkholderia fungorum TaxID=134537 RepID=UPI0038B83D16
MDLIRELLLKLETLPLRSGDVWLLAPDTEDIQMDGFDADQIGYHLSLIRDAGFIDTGGIEGMDGLGFRSLTWPGHDFLDSVRSPEVWDKTKTVAAAAGGFTVDLLVTTAKAYLEMKLKGLIGG